MTRRLAVVAIVVLSASCSSAPPVGQAPSASPATTSPTIASPAPAATLLPAPTSSPGAPVVVPPTGAPPTGAPPTAGGIYWATISGQINPAWQNMPARVYVPDEGSGDIVVIDPSTFKIVSRFNVGRYPEHITPSWDGKFLYVNNMKGGSLTEIDPLTARPTGKTIKVPSPYNLYYTPDGQRSIIVEDMLQGAPANSNGLQFYDRKTWTKIGFVPIPWAGANHLDFTADGKRLFLSCEYTGRIVQVDVENMKVISSMNVGGSPTDVRLAPDGKVVFVANQLRNGIDVIDAATFEYKSFIALHRGAHGIAVSRDASQLFVTNRRAASLSVIDLATLKVVATWSIGGTPDMIAVSVDGSQLWISNRYSGTITVVNSRTGAIIKTIATGLNPHGLAYWPLPGRYSLGHNGNMR
jgi:YVTN family beta-propeller protein